MKGEHGRESNKPFDGFVVIFGGDFSQIFPVIPKGSRLDIVHASLCSSKASWCRVLNLSKNMHMHVCFKHFKFNYNF